MLNTLRFGIDLSSAEPDLQFRGKPLSHYDAVLPRIGASITYFGTAVVRQFEQMDVYTPNTANGIANARDKLRAFTNDGTLLTEEQLAAGLAEEKAALCRWFHTRP